MAAQEDREHDVTVVDVDVQLINSNRQDFKKKVLDLFEGGERDLLLDFSNTTYIDSSGLGILVSLSKTVADQGGRFRITGLNDDMKVLFELTKLDTLFRIVRTREEALQAPAWTTTG